MRKHVFFMLLLALLVPWAARAQNLSDSYAFSTGVDSTAWMTLSSSATEILTPASSGSDGKASVVTNLGFTFTFAGVDYTQFSVNTDGTLRFGSTVVTTGSYSTPFGSSNLSANQPKICALGCDGYMKTDGYGKYEVVVDDSGDTVGVMEMKTSTYNSTSRPGDILFQIQLYASTGEVRIVYGAQPSVLPNVTYQIGMSASTTDIILFNTATATMQEYTAATSDNNPSGTWPAAWRYYSVVVDPTICQKPTALTVSDVTASSATLSWTGQESHSGYTLVYSTSVIVDPETDVDAVSESVAGTTYDFDNLEATTTYYVMLKASCSDGGESGWSSVSFRTTGIPYSEGFPYTTGFEEDDDTGWELANGTNAWVIDTVAKNTGDYGLYISNDNGVSNAYTITTATRSWAYRTMQFDETGEYAMTFDWKAQGESTWDYIRAFLVPAGYTFVADELPDGVTSTSTFSSTTPAGWIDIVGGKLNLQGTSWQTAQGTFPIATAGIYNVVLLWVNDGSGGTQPPAAIDNLTITQLTCPAPINLALEDAQPESLTISWQSIGQESQWLVSVNGEDPEIANDTVYTIENLNPATLYNVSVRAYCGGDDTSFAISDSWFTGCAPLTEESLLYIEDFESYASGSSATISPCWTKGTNSSTAYPYPSTTVVTGTRSLYFYGYYPSSATSTRVYSWAALPPVDESLTMSDLTVSFNVKRGSTASNYYTTLVLVGVADSVAGLTSADALDSTVVWIDTIDLFSEPASSIHEIEVSLAGYEGEGRYVVLYAPVPELRGTATYAYNYAYVDDVMLAYSSSCPRPESVDVSSIEATAATISWVDPAEAGSYVVTYQVEGSTEEPESLTTTDTTVDLSELTPNTAYVVNVMADCSGEMSSPRSTTFRTACAPMTVLPWSEDFENAATGTSAQFPYCMYRLNNGTSTNYYPYVSSSTTYNHTPNGSKGLYWYNTTTSGYGDYQIVVLPSIDAETYPMNTVQVRFWAKASTSTYNVQFQVGVMTDPTADSTFELVQNVNVGGNTTWAEFTVPFGTYQGEGQYVAIKAVRPSSSWYAYVDDITLELMPNCPAVTDLTATATASAAILSWNYQEGYNTPAGYVVTYDSLAGTNPTILNVTTNSTIITGLEPHTTYMAYVQANCGEDGLGVMDSIEFVTGPSSTIDFAGGTSTSYYLPIGNYFHYSYTQQLITAEEMGNLATQITGIEFEYAYGTPMTDKTNVTIYLANTDSTSLSSAFIPYDSVSFVPVYSGSLNCTQGWNHFQFTTPFNYNGTSNLLIVVHDNSDAYDGTSYTFKTHSATGKGRYVQNDSNPYSLNSITGGTSTTYRANMKLHYVDQTGVTCVAPAVVASNATGSTVDLIWAPGNDETSWDVDYRLVGDSVWTNAATGISTNSYTVTGLNDGMVYQFRVSFTCADNNTLYAGTTTATTACGLITNLPWMEDFNSFAATTTATEIPCWDYIGVGGYVNINNSSTYSHGGNCLRFYPNSSSSSDHVILLPEFADDISGLELTFWTRPESASNSGSFSVGYVTDPAQDSTFVEMLNIPCSMGTTITQYEVIFAGAPAGSRIAMRHNVGSTAWYWFIDDVEVHVAPTCVRPTDIEVSDITDNSATITVVDPNSANNYRVYITNNGVTDSMNITSATAVFTGLTSATTYIVSVLTICDDGTLTRSISTNFTTALCSGAQIVATGDPDSTTSTTYYAPVNNYYKYTLSETIIDSAELGGPMEITSIAYYYNYTTPTTAKTDVTIWLQPTNKSEFTSTTDIVALDSATAVMVYQGNLNCAQGWNYFGFTTPYNYDGNGNLLVIVDDNSNAYNGTSYTFKSMATTEYKTMSYYSDSYDADPVNPNSYSGSKYRYQWRPVMQLISCGEGCPAPIIGNVAVTSDNVTVAFTADGTVEAAIVEGATFTATTGTAMTGSTYTFTNLQPATEYTFGLRTVCEDGATSSWVTRTVTTDSAVCFVPTNVTVSATTFDGATITWTAGGEETAWEVRVYSTTFDQTYTANTNSLTVSGLNEGTFNVSVRALCSATNSSEWSEPIQFSTESCLAPTGVTVSGITANSATVSWPAVATSNGSYTMEYGFSGFSRGQGTTVEVTGTTYTITGLESEAEYDVYVASYCGENIVSPWSTVTSFTTIGGQETYTITVQSNNTAWGTVTGGGTYPAGTQVTLTATATSIGEFVEWQDGNTEAQRSIVVTGNATYTATFREHVGIDDVDGNAIALYPNPASTTVTIAGMELQSQIVIVDMNGREVYRATAADGSVKVDVSNLSKGAYFVRITGEKTNAIRKLVVK